MITSAGEAHHLPQCNMSHVALFELKFFIDKPSHAWQASQSRI
jgi:hypothetical protein